MCFHMLLYYISVTVLIGFLNQWQQWIFNYVSHVRPTTVLIWHFVWALFKNSNPHWHVLANTQCQCIGKHVWRISNYAFTTVPSVYCICETEPLQFQLQKASPKMQIRKAGSKCVSNVTLQGRSFNFWKAACSLALHLHGMSFLVRGVSRSVNEGKFYKKLLYNCIEPRNEHTAETFVSSGFLVITKPFETPFHDDVS